MSKKPQPLLTLEDFFVNASLYDEYITNTEVGRKELARLNEQFRFDCFCPQCATHSTFLIDPLMTKHTAGARAERKGGFFEAVPIDPLNNNGTVEAVRYYAICQRHPTHYFLFWVKFKNWTVTKIGQDPALADIALGDLARFAKVLTKEDRAELTRAVGLYSHGVGIGAFVYLRRIFERLVHSTYAASTSPNKPPPEEFRFLRLDDRVSALANELPSFLTKNSTHIYSLLSAGLHEFEEDACLKMFPVLKQAIVMILEEDLTRKQRMQREQEVARLLNDTHSEAKNGQKTPGPAKGGE